MKKVTTKSGSFYIIDEKRNWWTKNDSRLEGGRLQYFYCVHPEDYMNWYNNQEFTKLPLQVGAHLFITGGTDNWWMSTPIVSIEEVEDGD